MFSKQHLLYRYYSSAIPASTLSNNVLLGLQTGFLPSSLNSIHFSIQSPSPSLTTTCPHCLSIPFLMTVVIGSTTTSLLNSSPVVVYPLPWHLVVGECDVPACGPPTSFSVHLASSAVTPAGVCPQIQE